MPPANSPNREPTPSNFASALRGLESPNEDVLNLAATLTTQASDAAADLTIDVDVDMDMEMDVEMDEARRNLRYLRTAQELDQQRLEQSRERLRQLERARDELDLTASASASAPASASASSHRDRLRRSMDRLNRLHEASAAAQYANANGNGSTTANANVAAAAAASQYGARVPSQNSLYDWSPLPSTDLDDDEARTMQALRARLGLSSNPAAADSLRSTAILQAVRRHPRFSARTREYLQRYNRERDALADTAREGAPQPREGASLRRSTQDPWSGPRERYQASSQQSHPHSQPHPQPPPPVVSPMLEHTVKYLARIRHANSVDESLNCALEAGFHSKDHFRIQYADFLTDTSSIPPPQPTSWLAPGAVLSGCQHATNSTPTSHLATGQLPPPTRPWLSNSYSTPRSLASSLSPNTPTRADPLQAPPHQDRWPVKVTVHAVDWSEMTLSATMEAYNVPSHPHQHSLTNPSPSAQYTRTSSITTYLEGEILDFNTHTLLTESFKSSAANDALYWRKLPPFRNMGDEQVVQALTSRRWWEGLNRDWVLMRWKERCFVKSLRSSSKLSGQSPTSAPPIDGFVSANATPQDSELEYYIYDSHTFARHAIPPSEIHEFSPQLVDAEHAAFDDSGCGLTISGFYYVSLRRSDGRVEGLYYDPMSSPYQCLMLDSHARGRFGSWEFA